MCRRNIAVKFAGLAAPAMLDHLVRLGITTVELLPCHAFFGRAATSPPAGLRNYWGYNSIGFFAPEPRYLSNGGIREFQSMVRSFHSAGIEVVLDVVYNHTAEGNELGPTLCFRGIDNASYYRLIDGDPRHYVNDTGCGNTVNLSHPRVLQLVLDSLRYWVEVMHVRRFSFRPRSDDAGPRGPWVRPAQWLFRCGSAGSAPVTRQTDRRTLGCRARGLSPRTVSAWFL